MLLVQDQYGQNSRKNFDTELQCKQNTPKQVFSDAKETWEIESGCEEALTSGNDSAGEDAFFPDPSSFPEEILEPRRHINPRKKNVRFGRFDYNYVGVFDTSEASSFENDYLRSECGYLEPGRRRSLAQDQETSCYKVKNHYRVAQETPAKWRSQDCGHDKSGYVQSMEERPMGADEHDVRRMRRKEHHCGRHHCEDFDDVIYKKLPHRAFKFECGDDITARCCDHWTEKKNYVKMKPMVSTSPKHFCHMMDPDADFKSHRKYRPDVRYDPQVPCCCPEEFYDQAYSAKTKKKILESVQEQQEQFSDSTYKIPCSKFSSQTISGELSVLPKKKSSEKLANSSTFDWMYYGGRRSGGPPRIHKMRSRRTRMNRIKNGWKKALVQTVRDGSRNERVGLIVMGSKGPEFYAKNSKKPLGVVPFRKSKSFLDGSFEVMTVDCKNVFLSSSEPASKTNYAINDLISPEDDEKMEEKIARFRENVNEIVKNSEEKFYKSLSSTEYQQKTQTTEEMLKQAAAEGVQEENEKDEKADDVQKFSPLRMHPFETITPRLSAHQEKKINEDSKAMADALNEQAKQYKENQSNLKDKEDTFLEELKELKEKYLPKDIAQETAVPNLSLWSVKLDQLSEETEARQREIEESKKDEDKTEKLGKEELSQTGSVKSTEQISLNKQRRKKYYESTTGEKKGEEEGEAIRSKPQSPVATPKQAGRRHRWESPFGKHKTSEGEDSNLISAVFRDLVENGCAISKEESENLQNIFNRVSNHPEVCSNEVGSSCSSEVINTTGKSKLNVSPRSPTSMDDAKGNKLTEKEEKKVNAKGFYKKERSGNVERREESESFLEEVSNRKVLKIRNFPNEKVLDSKSSRKMQGKSRKIHLEDKMKILRKALPRSSISSSLAAENEAAHLKQLKKYIDRFIDRVEASTASEFSKRKEVRINSRDSRSTDSSEVQVDARKILDFVSNPFKKISSDVTISLAKKLTDALVQNKATKSQKNFSSSIKARKHSENESDEEGLLLARGGVSSGSEHYEDPEPTYLKQLKKMRNEHLNNILLEIKRLSELLRFLDRCNRLHF